MSKKIKRQQNTYFTMVKFKAFALTMVLILSFVVYMPDHTYAGIGINKTVKKIYQKGSKRGKKIKKLVVNGGKQILNEVKTQTRTLHLDKFVKKIPIDEIRNSIAATSIDWKEVGKEIISRIKEMKDERLLARS